MKDKHSWFEPIKRAVTDVWSIQCYFSILEMAMGVFIEDIYMVIMGAALYIGATRAILPREYIPIPVPTEIRVKEVEMEDKPEAD